MHENEAIKASVKNYERVIKEFALEAGLDPTKVLRTNAVSVAGVEIILAHSDSFPDEDTLLIALELDPPFIGAEQGYEAYYRSLLELNFFVPGTVMQFGLLPGGNAVLKQSLPLRPETRGKDVLHTMNKFIRNVAAIASMRKNLDAYGWN